ncbi:hypothetical protein II906_11950 [bacterium]|nr:hypothetical protein [bacterium]
MICPQCNNNLADGVVYCPYCRQWISEMTTNQQDTVNENDSGFINTPSNENDNGYTNNPNGMYNTYSGNTNSNNNSYTNNPNGMYNTYSGNTNGTNNGYTNNPNRMYNTYSGNANGTNNNYLNNRINNSVYPSHLVADDPPQQEEYFPMTWYKILTYFLLPLGVLMNLYYGKQILGGSQYGELKEFVYTMFGSLKVVDTAAGVFCLFFAVWTGLTCVWLWRKKKIAPLSLYACYILNYGSTILLYIAYINILPDEIFGLRNCIVDIIRSIFMGGFLTYVNYKYFENRRSLFVY